MPSMENDSVRRVRALSLLTRVAVVAAVALAACKGSDPIVADVDAAPKASSSSSAKAATSEPSVAKPAPSPPSWGYGGGGCPCGCDHSEDMVEELRAGGRDHALRAIEDALHTIGEREDAGYITERMVQHRLRLLGFGRELGRTGPARFTTASRFRADALAKSSAIVKVRADLFFHGEATEIVHQKEKLLRASFVVRLEVANLGVANVTVHPPTLESKVSLPVSRWYVAGGDGEPWNGVLPAGDTKLVHVIGYAGEPVQPGTDVDATIHFESLSLPANARARRHWKQAY